MFIGREAELDFLQDKYEERRGQLVVLYGRRRVGKTETLREFCKGKPHIFYSCTQSTDKVQLSKFSKQITLWGSSKVVNKWVQFRENGTDPEKAAKNLFLVEDIMNEMRKDLGLKKVQKGNLLAFFVNDIKKAMKKK